MFALMPSCSHALHLGYKKSLLHFEPLSFSKNNLSKHDPSSVVSYFLFLNKKQHTIYGLLQPK
jgi:hypothetical protein